MQGLIRLLCLYGLTIAPVYADDVQVRLYQYQPQGPYQASSANQQQSINLKQAASQKQSYWVFQAQDLSKLQLALQNPQQQYLHSFAAWQQQLGSCKQLKFAMNAGMFHPNYAPVGLYIESGKQHAALNQQTGFGNFFMKPNGVLAWQSKQAFVGTTAQWLASGFKADYATQSGPMLVTQGKINPQFQADSESKTIRNGVGIKQGKLYFVISQGRVNFYQFAQFFKDELQVENALYLDGSISSLYAPALKRQDRAYKLGPMVGYIDSTCS